MEALVREAVRRPARCRIERRIPGHPDRFACTAGAAAYRVVWERYGTGRYTIARVDGGRERVVARGTLIVTE
jgi:hypothetical protein